MARPLSRGAPRTDFWRPAARCAAECLLRHEPHRRLTVQQAHVRVAWQTEHVRSNAHAVHGPVYALTVCGCGAAAERARFLALPLIGRRRLRAQAAGKHQYRERRGWQGAYAAADTPGDANSAIDTPAARAASLRYKRKQRR